VSVVVIAEEASADWQIAGVALSRPDYFLQIRPSTSRASTVGRPEAITAHGHLGITDVPAWLERGSAKLRLDFDLQDLFVDNLAHDDSLMPGDYDLVYQVRARIRRAPTPALPKPEEQKVVLTSNSFTITILPPTAADLAWCLTTVNDPGAKPTDLQRAMMIARAAPVAHRRAVLESTLSDPWYRQMALLRLAADRPDPSLAGTLLPWVDNDDEEIAACAIYALAACDPVQALLTARQIGPQMRRGQFRTVVKIFSSHGEATDIPVLEAMLKHVPEPSETEMEYAGFDVKQADRDKLKQAIDAIKARTAGK